ncbi:MAG TPA: polymer-forming cytoskeletal protein [Candidatus Dormibacteraeota bacterium]
MDVQEAVAESTPIEAAQDKKDGLRRFTMGPNDSLEGKLTYDGHVHVDGRAEGELRVSGNIEVASGAKVKALLEASNVTIKGDVEGTLNARDKLVLGKNARLSGDVTVRRLQIEDGASLNGHVRMGDFEHQGSGG